MPLSQHQGDLLLDAFETCRNVRDLYERKTAAEVASSDPDLDEAGLEEAMADVTELTRLYDSAAERAAEVYGEAAMYVPNELLNSVANDLLPEHLMVEAA